MVLTFIQNSAKSENRHSFDFNERKRLSTESVAAAYTCLGER